jgi:hypothetical protein
VKINSNYKTNSTVPANHRHCPTATTVRRRYTEMRTLAAMERMEVRNVSIHTIFYSYLITVQWRDPTLTEVLDYLTSGNNVIRMNAAGYLQHLTFADNETKRRVRELGGIQVRE